MFVGTDKRGKGSPANKTSGCAFEKEHIESFPTVDSHYTRKDTTRKYLPPDLSIRRMYSLNADKCKEMVKTGVTEAVYRSIFCREYNLSFVHPKKDQCQVCNNYDNLKSEGTLNMETENNYQEHQNRKQLSRVEKENDKKKAKTDPCYNVTAFDLQAVLTTPCSLIGELYYERKLC